MGDALIAFPGTLRLIEFKAKGNYSTKEAECYQKLSTILQDAKYQVMQKISRKVHWYVETSPSKSGGVEAFFSPYLDAFDEKSHKRQLFQLEKFIESVADDAVSQRENEQPQIEKDYLKTVPWCQGVKKMGLGD
ncbi:hypothetical protein LU604_04640 [Erwinia tracheiphila]|uniref:Uncharacterized protein n=1 Tax=Erwinia tracheiphila TaxID=65700 RepID=A0A345CU79_9GAMM|nr:hypothetical protein [Erwinia tracheiphila]AXF76996.1 hypothetical protein AV903_14700 [Erwinia tracheiphila]UIA84321.1 hypothetical protein LU604_04640 [Erwinia tracheiphila]UIA92904.1 hypothetical protein LU632_04600 [Erwinia tracheiphila]